MIFNESDIPIIAPTPEPSAPQPGDTWRAAVDAPRVEQPAQTVEVCRSFAYKLNLQNHGGPMYESADFFASRKMQCNAEDAAWMSQQIFEECVAEIRETVRLFIEDMKSRKGAKIAEQQRRAG